MRTSLALVASVACAPAAAPDKAVDSDVAADPRADGPGRRDDTYQPSAPPVSQDTDAADEVVDEDGDGVPLPVDCDDTRRTVFPGAREVCDGLDQDCDGQVDEGLFDDWVLLSLQRDGLVRIDPNTGVETPYRSYPDDLDARFNSFDVAPEGVAYGHHNRDLALYRMDLCAEQFVPFAPTGVGDMGGITFTRPDTLIGLDQRNGNWVSLDVTTGAATVLRALDFGAPGTSGATYDCTHDRMFAVGSSGFLWELDPDTLDTIKTTELDLSFSSIGLAYDHRTGRLLLSTGRPPQLHWIDPDTGEVTVAGALARQTDDLAFHPPCPPP